ncbi:MAG: phBC6A51 family helix-turn-helix protein [Patescibacteria group bacterium]
MKKDDTKQKKQKEMFTEQLKKTPIVQIVCERLEIGRTTYYRWKRQDVKFSEECNKAMEEGCALINDIAESQLISAMKDNNLTAVMYWLNHRHNIYKNKLEVTTKISDGKLSPEQEADINKAEKLLMPNSDSGEKRGQNAKKKIK